MTEVHEITRKEFETFIKTGLVLVDFSAEWCMPCIIMAPILDELAKKFKGKIKFAKIVSIIFLNLQSNPSVWSVQNYLPLKNYTPKNYILTLWPPVANRWQKASISM